MNNPTPTRSPTSKKKVAAGHSRGTSEFKLIPIEVPVRLPDSVLEACSRLEKAGYKAWLAGGCVRDSILGRKPKDWDIVTNAPMEQIKRLFPKHLEVGAAFGIIKLPPLGEDSDAIHIDVAIFRHEEGYSDFRHPDKVEVGNEQTDVARRDFTMNAMYYDPKAGQVLDAVGGHKDIASKTIRTVGAPEVRFSEDALRILRAVRFSAQLGFKIEKDTSAALKKCSGLLKNISRERIREEVFRLLSSSRPVMGLEALAQNGLWEHVFDVRRVSVPADLRQLRLSWIPTPLHWICALGVSGLLGDPIKEPAAIVERVTDSLRLSNIEKRVLSRTLHVYRESIREADVSTHCSPHEWVDLARSDKALMDIVKSFIRRARGPSEKEKTDALNLIEQSLRWAAKPGAEKAWPQAEDLLKEGIKQGPKLGAELKARHWKAFWVKPT